VLIKKKKENIVVKMKLLIKLPMPFLTLRKFLMEKAR
jgi:hypothetical protein